MPGKFDSFEYRCKQAFDCFLETKRAELEAAVVAENFKIMNDRYAGLKQLCADLDHAFVTNSEHQALLKRASKTEEEVKAEVAEKVATKLEDLQKQLDHELEKRNLVHRLETSNLEAEVKALRAATQPAAQPAAPGGGSS